MEISFICRRLGITLASISLAWVAGGLSGCGVPGVGLFHHESKPAAILQATTVTWGTNLTFEQNFWQSFAQRNKIQTQFVPNFRLAAYQQLLKAHSGAPDVLEMDVVWASILADDLVDLRPYLTDQKAFVPQLLTNYTVNGRLIALPVYVDLGVLYYRPQLLRKYGFSKPPATWEELAMMARRIQDGERRGGNKWFWGYVWQGSASEGGTCNALEWQASAGGGNFIEAPGRINVRNRQFLGTLQRAADWIGSISPPAEYVYKEDDSVNIWQAGQTAFMRNWASAYGQLAAQQGKDQPDFAVAPLPGGPGGQRGTLGGLGIAVSKYAANRDLAIKGLLELTNEQNDLARLVRTGGIPTRIAVMERPDVKARSLLLAVSAELMGTLVARPSLMAGEKYDAVSAEYSKAVSSVLRRQATPEAAMGDLEKRLTGMTGFRSALIQQ
jgi:trehalose/maltose transport system substrate-binding protein